MIDIEEFRKNLDNQNWGDIFSLYYKKNFKIK